MRDQFAIYDKTNDYFAELKLPRVFSYQKVYIHL